MGIERGGGHGEQARAAPAHAQQQRKRLQDEEPERREAKGAGLGKGSNKGGKGASAAKTALPAQPRMTLPMAMLNIQELQSLTPHHKEAQRLHLGDEAQLIQRGRLARAAITGVSLSRSPQASPTHWTEEEAASAMRTMAEGAKMQDPPVREVRMPQLPPIPVQHGQEAGAGSKGMADVDDLSVSAAADMGLSDLMTAAAAADGASGGGHVRATHVMEQDEENDRKQGTKRDGKGREGPSQKKGSAALLAPLSPLDEEQFPALCASNPAVNAQLKQHKKGDRSPGQQGVGAKSTIPALPPISSLPGPALPLGKEDPDVWEARVEQEMAEEREADEEALRQARQEEYSRSEVENGVEHERLYQQQQAVAAYRHAAEEAIGVEQERLYAEAARARGAETAELDAGWRVADVSRGKRRAQAKQQAQDAADSERAESDYTLERDRQMEQEHHAMQEMNRDNDREESQHQLFGERAGDEDQLPSSGDDQQEGDDTRAGGQGAVDLK
jgi:hypothetical protein